MVRKSKNNDIDRCDIVLFDNRLLEELRMAINKEHKEIIFAKRKTYYDTSKHRRNEKSNVEISDFIESTLIRIEDICNHLIKIQKDVKNDQFVLFDFMTCSETLLNCIILMAEQFEADLSSFKNSKMIFCKDYQIGKSPDICLEKQPRCKEKCKDMDSDLNYFKYLRSLCSVHPTETTFHCIYILGSEEWCPCVEKFIPYPILGDRENPDYNAKVWANNSYDSRIIGIHVYQIFEFVKKAYSELMQIVISAVNNYYVNKIDELYKKHILSIEECIDSFQYLDNLEIAVSERCGREITHNVRYWRRIMKTEFSDSHMKDLLNEYKQAIINDIEQVRIKLQILDLEELYDFFPMPSSVNVKCSRLNDYSYEREKIESYLCRFEDIDENFELNDNGRYDSSCYYWESCSNRFNKHIDDNSEFCYWVRVKSFLDELDVLISKGATHEELASFGRYIDFKFKTRNGEWARVQLKTIESVFTNCVFDYGDSDWNLYMQYCVAKWSIRD